MKQHVPQPDPWVLASMQISDIISRLLMGPDRGRITVGPRVTDVPTGWNKVSPKGQRLPSQPPCLHRRPCSAAAHLLPPGKALPQEV